jgi:hypothetical protein
MDSATHAAVVIDLAAYRAARAATRPTAVPHEDAPGALVAHPDPDRLQRLKDLTPREITHRARMLWHLEGGQS